MILQVLGLWTGGWWLATAGLMVWSSKVGKFRARERLLDFLALRGDERVLDVGCGRGLLLTAAARRVPAGHAVGVDRWREEDQSNNRPTATRANARAEGVADRIALVTGDARALPFSDASFDALVSSLTLHNISDAAGRERAVRELARVLKPGGRLALLDFRHTGDYARVLRDCGLRDVTRSRLSFTIYPPVQTVTGTRATLGKNLRGLV